jgi:hypothetical protein
MIEHEASYCQLASYCNIQNHSTGYCSCSGCCLVLAQKYSLRNNLLLLPASFVHKHMPDLTSLGEFTLIGVFVVIRVLHNGRGRALCGAQYTVEHCSSSELG